MALSAYNTTPRGWDESATGPTDNDSIYSADVRAAFPGGKASGVKVHDRKPRDTPPAREPAVNAKPLPAKLASKFTGIAYAAVETTLFERIDDGVLMGMATDGNGRQTLVDNIDRNLGMVNRHLQVLVAHHGEDVHDFAPGYMDHNDPLGKLVWVLL